MKYKFKEDEILKELANYINSTYNSHYSAGGQEEVQEFEAMTSGNSLGGFFFSKESARKYLSRIGHKEGYNRKDLLKAAHFCILALYAYDKLKDKGIIEKLERVMTEENEIK